MSRDAPINIGQGNDKTQSIRMPLFIYLATSVLHLPASGDVVKDPLFLF
jgi:hypothetical protein